MYERRHLNTSIDVLDKNAALEMARERLESKYGDKVSTEEVVNSAGRLLLEQSGVAVGSRIRILCGKYKGREFIVDVVSWSEAEVKVQGPGWSDGRWFGLWHRPEFQVIS